MDGDQLRLRSIAGSTAAPAGAPPCRRVASSDPDALFANIPMWQIEHQLLSAPQTVSQGSMMLLGQIGLASNRFGGRVRAMGSTPRDQVAVGLDMAGRPGRQFGGRALDWNEALIGYSGAELDYITPQGFLGLSVTLPAELLGEVLRQRLAGPVELSRYRSVRIANAGRQDRPATWRLFAWLTEMLHAEATPAGGPAALALLQAEVVDAVGSLVGRHLEDAAGDSAGLWHHRRPVTLRAEAYMRANLSEPLMLHQICAAARASERTVEYAFRDVYGVGAKRFLKILRLNQVRRELRDADPALVVIQEVAQRAGFWHMGHFSADYRRLFGEAPSATLPRPRPGQGRWAGHAAGA